MKATPALLLTGLVVTGIAACGADGGDEPAASPSQPTVPAPTTTVALTWPDEPPPVVFDSDGGTIAVEPFTVCWSAPTPDDPDVEYESGYCADGMPEIATSPVVMPVDGEIRFTFEMPGWHFSADYLGTTGGLVVTQIDDTAWSLSAPAKSLDELVIVSGFGPQGDVHVAIALPESEPGSTTALEESIGETFVVDIRDRCADGISVGIADELFLISGELSGVTQPVGREWRRSDFPAGWDVEVLNAKPVDGDGWVMRGAEALRVDEATIEVSDPATGDLIGVFVLDQRSPQERFFCG